MPGHFAVRKAHAGQILTQAYWASHIATAVCKMRPNDEHVSFTLCHTLLVYMSTEVPTSIPQSERRERFRAYMKAFNPTAPAREVISAGLVIDDLHRSLFLHLASRADLEPGSQQLVVGGIGSGKTTELLLAEIWLRREGHTLPLYIDITAETDLSGLNSGALLAAFGLHLGDRFFETAVEFNVSADVINKLMPIHLEIKQFAYGKQRRIWVEREPEDFDPDPEEEEDSGYYVMHNVPGKLSRPLPGLLRDIQEIRKPLIDFLELVKTVHKDIVVIFDGLDRLVGPEKFWAVAHQDFRILRELGVSVLATAPISVLYGIGKTVSEHFDRVHHLTPIATDPAQLSSLDSIIAKRGGYHMLDANEASLISKSSGGVLRDLVSLARDAAEEAYIAGSDRIRMEDVKKVARQLGTSYRRGLGADQVKTLMTLYKSKSFVVTLVTNVELLVSRRVLEYSSTEFRVHPALLDILLEEAEQMRA